MECALHEAQSIEGRSEHAQRRDDGKDRMSAISSQQHQKLADEITQARKTQGRNAK